LNIYRYCIEKKKKRDKEEREKKNWGKQMEEEHININGNE